MKHKLFVIPLILLAIILAYLVLAYNSIYFRMGQANLSYPEVQAMYKFNEQIDGQAETYVALGDSLTYGVGTSNYEDSYPYLIAKNLAGQNKKMALLPLAYPGYKTTDLIDHYLNEAVVAKPSIVTILIGINDMHDRATPAQFKAHYQTIIDTLKAGTQAKIYLISLPFIGDSNLMPYPYQNYFMVRTNEFNKVIKELAKENKLEYVDITTETREIFKKPGSHYAADHFHPSAEGYKLFTALIYDHLNK